jgi:hypothetical protein
MVSATSPPAGFDDDEPHLTDAVRAAAGDLRASGPLPRSSEDVLRFAVRDRLRDAGVSDIAHENSSITGGWSPIPGKLDLYTPARRPHRWAAEAKVWDVDQQIWDAIKLAAGIAHGDVLVGYLIAAAPPTAFAQYDGAELYAPGSHEHMVRDLLATNPRAWQKLLNGGSGSKSRPRYTRPCCSTSGAGSGTAPASCAWRSRLVGAFRRYGSQQAGQRTWMGRRPSPRPRRVPAARPTTRSDSRSRAGATRGGPGSCETA